MGLLKGTFTDDVMDMEGMGLGCLLEKAGEITTELRSRAVEKAMT